MIGEQLCRRGLQCVRECWLLQHLFDSVGEFVMIARFEQQSGPRACDDLSESAGACDNGWRASGHGLEGNDAKRFVQRWDDGATGSMQNVAQVVVGDEAGKLHDVAETLDVDLRLQLGKIRTASGDDALNAGHASAQRANSASKHLEALLVLNPAPSDH